MTHMSEHLFVYGTLMSRAVGARLGKAQRARLQREATNLGAATIEGRLYDLGRYPALSPPAVAGELVHGEVFRLANPTASFKWLDIYENFAPADTDREYDRVVRSVRLATGEDIDAWVYLYRGQLVEAKRVADGRWLPK